VIPNIIDTGYIAKALQSHQSTRTMEPDELYTLRAQYYLGHYTLSLQEAKATARRPLSNDLKIEREEFQLRSMLALKQYDKVIDSASDISPGK
jgi:hypothetical protein